MSSRLPESSALPINRLSDAGKETGFTEAYVAGAKTKAEQLLALTLDPKTQELCRALLTQIAALETNATNNPAPLGLIAMQQLKVSELLARETMSQSSAAATSTYFDSHYYTP